MPAKSKEQFRKIAVLCKEHKMKESDCKDFLHKGYYKNLPDRYQSVHYKRKS